MTPTQEIDRDAHEAKAAELDALMVALGRVRWFVEKQTDNMLVQLVIALERESERHRESAALLGAA